MGRLQVDVVLSASSELHPDVFGAALMGDVIAFSLRGAVSTAHGAAVKMLVMPGMASPLAPWLKPVGAFSRIGDAVASRNIHAAVLDALRLGQAL